MAQRKFGVHKIVLFAKLLPNPDEFLNQDVKSHLGKQRIHSKSQMLKTLNSHLKKRQKQPHIIQNFVKGCHPRYSA